MRLPVEALLQDQLKRLFWLALLLTLLMMALLNILGAPLVTPAAPYGIVSYELAGSPARTAAVLASWDADARLHAAFSLGLDYVFMLLYPAAISLGCIWAARALSASRWPLARLGAALAWGQWLAAGFDALENVALVRLLFGGPVGPWSQAAAACAALKFALIFLGLVYAFLGLAVHLSGRLSLRQAA